MTVASCSVRAPASSTRCSWTPAAPAVRRPTCAAWRRRSRDARPDTRITVATTRSGAAALRADGWGDVGRDPGAALRGGPARAPPARRAGAAPRAWRGAIGADLIHSLASVAPDPHARHAARDHAARRDVLQGRAPSAASRRSACARSSSRAARHADAPDRRQRRPRATRSSTSSASTRRGSASSTTARHARTAPSRRARARVRERLGLGGPPRGAVRGREAPAQEPGAARPRGARSCPTTSWSCSPATPSPTTRELRALAAELGVDETRACSPDYVPRRRARGALGDGRLRGIPDARRGLRPAGARGDAARRAGGVLGPARCCARSAASCPALLRPGRPGGRGSRGRVGRSPRRGRCRGAARVGRPLHLGGGRRGHLGRLRARAGR